MFCLLIGRKIKLYRTRSVTVVLCGCETGCLTLEEHRLRVFENRALRKMYGNKKGEVRRNWRKLFNEEVHDLYFYHMLFRLSDQERSILHAIGRGELCRVLDGKLEGRAPLRRSWHRWRIILKSGVV
jgi:hypothetical protein